MDRVILGDNQFFAVNHLSDERSRQQAIRFKEDQAIIDVLDTAIDCGVKTFMFYGKANNPTNDRNKGRLSIHTMVVEYYF